MLYNLNAREINGKIRYFYRCWSQCLKTKISLLKISRHTPSYPLRNSARFLNWRKLNCARFRLKFYRSEEILEVEFFLPGWVEAARADLGYHSTDGTDTLCFCLKQSGNFYTKRIEALEKATHFCPSVTIHYQEKKQKILTPDTKSLLSWRNWSSWGWGPRPR